MDRQQIREIITERGYRGSSSESADHTGPRNFTFENLRLELDREVVQAIVIEADRLGVDSIALVAFALENHGFQAVNAMFKELDEGN